MAAYSPNTSSTCTRDRKPSSWARTMALAILCPYPVKCYRARQLFENIMCQRSGDAWRTYRGLEGVAKPSGSAELVETVS
jgi:hypothetical protein